VLRCIRKEWGAEGRGIANIKTNGQQAEDAVSRRAAAGVLKKGGEEEGLVYDRWPPQNVG
jgi:hypothetical protein